MTPAGAVSYPFDGASGADVPTGWKAPPVLGQRTVSAGAKRSWWPDVRWAGTLGQLSRRWGCCRQGQTRRGRRWRRWRAEDHACK